MFRHLKVLTIAEYYVIHKYHKITSKFILKHYFIVSEGVYIFMCKCVKRESNKYINIIIVIVIKNDRRRWTIS